MLEVKNLHSEWFPLTYPDTFYQKMMRNNVIAIGCFTKLMVSGGDREVILGTLLAKVQVGNGDIREIY